MKVVESDLDISNRDGDFWDGGYLTTRDNGSRGQSASGFRWDLATCVKVAEGHLDTSGMVATSSLIIDII